jgi:hypothetical protein
MIASMLPETMPGEPGAPTGRTAHSGKALFPDSTSVVGQSDVKSTQD